MLHVSFLLCLFWYKGQCFLVDSALAWHSGDMDSIPNAAANLVGNLKQNTFLAL